MHLKNFDAQLKNERLDFEHSESSQARSTDQISQFLQVLEMLSYHIMKKLKILFWFLLKKYA